MAVNRMNISYITFGLHTPAVKHDRQPFAPVVCGSKQYFMRGWDTGSGGRWVTWSGGSTPYYLAPLAVETTPNYTGTLQVPHVELVLTLQQ